MTISPKNWIQKQVFGEGVPVDSLKSEYERFLKETGSSCKKDNYFKRISEVNQTVKLIKNSAHSSPISFSMEKPKDYDAPPKIEVDESKDKKTIISVAYNIKTIEDLESFAEIDRDEWTLDRMKLNTWGNTVYPCYQITGFYKRRKKDSLTYEEFSSGVRTLLETSISPVRPQLPVHSQSENMLELSLVDHHLGQRSLTEETGEDYNLDIASSLYRTASMDIATRAFEGDGFDSIKFIVGSDYFNSDNHLSQTSSGTPQDEVSSWQNTFFVGAQLVIHAVDDLVDEFQKPVTLHVLKGNHDTERSYYLGVALYYRYLNDDMVTVINDMAYRQYINWGKCLIGLTHMDYEKEDSLPLIMSREAKKYWGECDYLEFHGGHLHKNKESVRLIKMIDEYQGIRIRHLPSLTAGSLWSKRQGYMHQRSSYGLIWNKERGNLSQYNFYI